LRYIQKIKNAKIQNSKIPQSDKGDFGLIFSISGVDWSRWPFLEVGKVGLPRYFPKSKNLNLSRYLENPTSVSIVSLSIPDLDDPISLLGYQFQTLPLILRSLPKSSFRCKGSIMWYVLQNFSFTFFLLIWNILLPDLDNPISL
jgi:hypothetical protein